MLIRPRHLSSTATMTALLCTLAIIAGLAIGAATASESAGAIDGAVTGSESAGAVESGIPLGAPEQAGDEVDTVRLVPQLGTMDCEPLVTVQNLGDEPTKALLLLFPDGSAECQGPTRVMCSGLIRPGRGWRFTVGGGGGSAVVLSASAETFQAPAADDGQPVQDIAADWLCTSLREILGECESYASLRAAWSGGGSWEGASVADLRGEPIDAVVETRCPLPGQFALLGQSAYSAGGASEQLLQVPMWTGFDTADLRIQNGGPQPATVSVQVAPECGGDPADCGAVVVHPGEARGFNLAGCPASVAGRTLRLLADQPIAAVGAATQGHLATALEGLRAADASTALAAPLWGMPQYGVETRLLLSNPDPNQEAFVDAVFYDSAGAQVARHGGALCPGGDLELVVPPSGEVPGFEAGMIRVRSWESASRAAPGPEMVGAVMVSRRHIAGDTAWGYAYPLLPALEGGELPALAAPVAANLDADGDTAEIVLTNLEERPGWTDATGLLYDGNGLVNTVCLRLAEHQTDYVNLERLGAVDRGFVGTLVVSPTAWNHGTAGQSPEFGLGLVTVNRHSTRAGEDIPGDEATARLGRRVPELAPELGQVAQGVCDTGLAPDVGNVDSVPGATFIPALRQHVLTDDVCQAALAIRNPTDAGIRAVVAAFGDPGVCGDCPGPIQVTCTPLIAPGNTWLHVDWPEGSRSAAVVAVQDVTVAAAGGPADDQRPVAEVLCNSLTGAECDSWRRLILALDQEGLHLGFSPSAAVTEAEVLITRSCPNLVSPGITDEASHPAIATLGRGGADGYEQVVSTVAAQSSDLDTTLYLQNAGTECVDVAVWFRSLGNCMRYQMSTGFKIPAGGSVAVPASDWVGPSFIGEGLVRSTGPVAVMAETTGPIRQGASELTLHGAIPKRQSADIDADGDVTENDVDAVRAALGQTEEGDGPWNPALDLASDGVIDQTDVEWAGRWLCGLDDEVDLPAPEPTQDSVVFLPALDPVEPWTCDSNVAVQNLGRAAKLALVLYGDECAAIQVICSPLLASGAGWTFEGHDWVAGVTHGFVISADDRPASEFGVSVPGDPSMADVMCERLGALTESCGAYGALIDALLSGGTFEGLPVRDVAGSPVAAAVERDCASDAELANSSYSGSGLTDLGAPAPDGMYRADTGPLWNRSNEFSSRITVMNTGPVTTTVAMTEREQDNCTGTRPCDPVEVPPGAAVDVPQCVGPSFQGNAWLSADQPLVVVVDTLRLPRRGDGIALGSRTGSPNRAGFDAGGTQQQVGGANSPAVARRYGTEAYAPLVMPPDAAWDSGVSLMNLALTQEAYVQVSFLGPDGEVLEVLLDSICPLASGTFFLPVRFTGGSDVSGSVHVRSLPLPSGGPPAPIRAELTLLHYSDAARSRILGFGDFPMQSEGEALSQYTGRASGARAVALPGIDLSDGREVLVVSNFVTEPGTTEVEILLSDETGIVAAWCLSLAATQTVTLDLATVAPPDFKGAALVMATEWDHRPPAQPNAEALAGIGAALIADARAGFNASEPPGDAVSIIAGEPLLALPAGFEVPSADCQRLPTPTPDTSPGTPELRTPAPPTTGTAVTPTPSGTPGTVTAGTATPGTVTPGATATDGSRFPHRILIPYASTRSD